MTRNELRRTALAFFGATLVSPTLCVIGERFSGYRDIVFIGLTFGIVYEVSVIFAVGLGLPTFLVLRQFRPGRWWSVLAVGILLGLIVALVWRRGYPFFAGPAIFVRDAVLFCPLSGLTALVFWMIWKPQSEPPAAT